MRNRSQKFFMLALLMGGVTLAGMAHAQYYGAGSTTHPSQQWQQQQQQWQAQAQQRANTYYYQPASPRQTAPQTQFMYRPELGTWVPTHLSPQAADRIGNTVVGCAGAGALGYARGGPIKGGIGCAAGALGITPGQLMRPKQAY